MTAPTIDMAPPGAGQADVLADAAPAGIGRLETRPPGAPPTGTAELCVLLTPRETGGHEVALLAWLADAVQLHDLQLRIVAPTPTLAEACRAAGLGAQLWPGLPAAGGRTAILQALLRWPPGQPLLLAPGVLHADAWLLAAAAALGHDLWVYVPMAYSARHMGYRQAGWRDRLLAPWLRQVQLWITVDWRQCRWLHHHWQLQAPVLMLPNLARVTPLAQPVQAPGADARLRVAVVGRFDPWQKGLDWLAGLLQDDPSWLQQHRWHFQGRGPGEALLQALASALGPQHALVHPHGPLQQALACNDVLLLPSRYEGVPLVALEATALGWPVVASHQAGLDGLLPPSSLFNFGDAQGLRQALAPLQVPAWRAQAVAHAQTRLARQHTQARYRPALAALMHHLRVGRHTGRHAGHHTGRQG